MNESCSHPGNFFFLRNTADEPQTDRGHLEHRERLNNQNKAACKQLGPDKVAL